MGDPLGLAGAARREIDEGRRREARAVRRWRAAVDQLFVMRTAAVTRLTTNHALGETVRESAGGDISVTLGMMQEQRCTTDFQGVVDLRRHVAIVERRRHQSGFQAGEIVNDERGRLGISDPVSRP